MKNIKLISSMLILTLFLASCSKQTDGPLGQSEIKGTIIYKNGDGTTNPTVSPTVYVAYGTKTATDKYDQTLIGNADGTYSIKGLAPGDYYITSTYTDNRLTYTTPGYAVTLGSKKGVATLDMTLE